jgi:hypothetical protein
MSPAKRNMRGYVHLGELREKLVDRCEKIGRAEGIDRVRALFGELTGV